MPIDCRDDNVARQDVLLMLEYNDGAREEYDGGQEKRHEPPQAVQLKWIWFGSVGQRKGLVNFHRPFFYDFALMYLSR